MQANSPAVECHGDSKQYSVFCFVHIVTSCFPLTSQQVGFNCRTSSWPSYSKVKC